MQPLCSHAGCGKVSALSEFRGKRRQQKREGVALRSRDRIHHGRKKSPLRLRSERASFLTRISQTGLDHRFHRKIRWGFRVDAWGRTRAFLIRSRLQDERTARPSGTAERSMKVAVDFRGLPETPGGAWQTEDVERRGSVLECGGRDARARPLHRRHRFGRALTAHGCPRLRPSSESGVALTLPTALQNAAATRHARPAAGFSDVP